MRFSIHNFTCVSFAVLTLLSGCGNSAKNSSSKDEMSDKDVKSNNLNISLLLDLSDRIDSSKYPNPSMEYYKRDLGYIASVAQAFATHVNGKKIRAMNDHMQVFFEPAPLNPKINEIAADLKIGLTKENVSQKILAEIASKYSHQTNAIYNLAKESKKYPGSNIWGFFSTKAKDYCIKPESRNILVVLTDGYVFHKDSRILEGNKSSFITPELIREFGLNKVDYASRFKTGRYGFIVKNKELQNLNVLVLGINPGKNNSYDEEVLELYWSRWLEEMGVKNYEIKSSDLPSNLDDVIKNYILQRAV